MTNPLAPVAVGGFLGSIARYGVALLAPDLAGTFVLRTVDTSLA